MIGKDGSRILVTFSDDEIERLTAEAKILKISRSEYIRSLVLSGRKNVDIALIGRDIRALKSQIEKIETEKPAASAPTQTPQPAQTAAYNPELEAAIMEILQFTRYRFLGVLSYDSMQRAGITVDKTAVQEKAAKAVLASIRNSEKTEV